MESNSKEVRGGVVKEWWRGPSSGGDIDYFSVLKGPWRVAQ